MAQPATHRAQRKYGDPVATVNDIDEALHHTSLAKQRDNNWRRWCDHLLDQRNRVARSGPRRETRIMYPDEYRGA